MTFAMNALLSIDGTSPYNAVYGRVPHLLPDINHVSRDTSGTLLGITRHAQRLREIAIERIVQETAKQRIGRALNTRTQTAAQETFNEWDLVDYYSPPTQKDLPGWTGPATVTSMADAHRGTIKIKFENREMIRRPQDLRPHLAFLSMHAAPSPVNLSLIHI